MSTEAHTEVVTRGEDLAHDVHHEHPSDLQYIYIGLFLAVVTAAEVGLYYTEIDFLLNTIILCAMMVVKFATVGMFFMHLRFDNRVFRWFFVTGLVLAIFVYLIVLTTFHFWSGH